MATSIPASREFEVLKITKLGKKNRILKLTLKGLSNYKNTTAAQPSSFHNWSHVREAVVEENRVVIRFTQNRGARQFQCSDPFELCSSINAYMNAFNAHVEERRRQGVDVGALAHAAVIEKQLLNNHGVTSEEELFMYEAVFTSRPLGLAISSLLDTETGDGTETSYGALITDSKNRTDIAPQSRIMQIDGQIVKNATYPRILDQLSSAEMPITLTLATTETPPVPSPPTRGEGETDGESETSSQSSLSRTRVTRRSRGRPKSAASAVPPGTEPPVPRRAVSATSPTRTTAPRASSGRATSPATRRKPNPNRRQSANIPQRKSRRNYNSRGSELKVNLPRQSSARSRSRTPDSATSDDEGDGDGGDAGEDTFDSKPARPRLARFHSDGEVEAKTPRGASGHRREYNVVFEAKPFGLGLGPWEDNRGARVKECTNPEKGVMVGSRILTINGARVKDHVYDNIMKKLSTLDTPIRMRFLFEGDGTTEEVKENIISAPVDPIAMRLMEHWDGMVFIEEAKAAEQENDFEGAINCYQQGVDSLANRLDISNLSKLDMRSCRTQLAVWRKHKTSLETKSRSKAMMGNQPNNPQQSSKLYRRKSDPAVSPTDDDNSLNWDQPAARSRGSRLGKKRRSLQVQSISVRNQRGQSAGRNAVTPTPSRPTRRTNSELPGSRTPDGRRRSQQPRRGARTPSPGGGRRTSATPVRRRAQDNNKNQDDGEEKKKSSHEKQDDQFRERLEADIIDDSLNVSFQDVQGLVEVKLALYETVILPALRPELFSGLRAPAKGILLFGPPGNGKTMIAKCVASECSATFFSISASSITSKWVGEAERIMRTLFTLARERAPSIIFIDEIDSMLTARGGKNEAESSRRIKTEFLIQFDGVHTAGEEDKRVVCIGATNLPDQLDEAVLRRFSKRIMVPLPDSEARYGLLRALMTQQENTAMSERDYRRVVKLTAGFSCSDLTNLCRDAAMGPIRDLGANIINISEDSMPDVTIKHFENSVRSTRASVNQESLNVYNAWNAEFGSTLTLAASALPENMRPHTLPDLS